MPDGHHHGPFLEMWQLKANVHGKLVAVKVDVSHAVRHQHMTPQQQQESKQQQGCWQQVSAVWAPTPIQRALSTEQFRNQQRHIKYIIHTSGT